jgi:hypothetical protein
MLLMFLPYLLGGAFFGGHQQPNVELGAAAAGLALWIIWILCHLRPSARSRSADLLAFTLGAWVFGSMVLFTTGRDLVDEYNSIPQVESFGTIEAALFTDGTITRQQLQDVIDHQSSVKDAIAKVEESDKELLASSTPDPQKPFEHLANLAAKATLMAQLLPDEEMSRIGAANRAVCDAGSFDNRRPICKATAEDLRNFRATFESKYRTWLSLLRAVGAI